MRISKLAPSNHIQGRWLCHLEDGSILRITENEIVAFGLCSGLELPPERLGELEQAARAAAVRDKAMDLLALRDHAAGELYAKLCRRFDPHTAAAAVARVGELGLLNDAGFARRRAAELLRKRKSRREILQDLAAKGIDRETAADALAALMPADGEEDPDLASARALVERQYARKLAEGKTQQVMAALARRGFSHAVIRAAVQPRDPEE